MRLPSLSITGRSASSLLRYKENADIRSLDAKLHAAAPGAGSSADQSYIGYTLHAAAPGARFFRAADKPARCNAPAAEPVSNAFTVVLACTGCAICAYPVSVQRHYAPLEPALNALVNAFT